MLLFKADRSWNLYTIAKRISSETRKQPRRQYTNTASFEAAVSDEMRLAIKMMLTYIAPYAGRQILLALSARIRHFRAYRSRIPLEQISSASVVSSRNRPCGWARMVCADAARRAISAATAGGACAGSKPGRVATHMCA